MTGGSPAHDWQGKWHVGFGAFRAGAIKMEGGGDAFDSSTGAWLNFGHEWRKGKIGLAVEDFFTFAKQSGDHYFPGGGLKLDFFESNCIIMGRLAVHFNDYICLSAGLGIGCNISTMEFDAYYYGSSGYDNDMCIAFCANADLRFSINPTRSFALDVGVNNVFTSARKYSNLVELKGGSSLLYLGVRFFW
jgi:hypothetical protein